MQVVTTEQPQILKLMLTEPIDRILLTDESENTSVLYTELTPVFVGYYYAIEVSFNLVNNRFYKIEAKNNKDELICYDKLLCTDGTDNRYIQRTTQNTFITL